MFKYLECELTYEYGKDIDNKLANFTRNVGTIRRTLSQCGRDTMMAVPASLYGSDAWVIKRRDESRIHSAKMRFLRAVKGCIRQYRIRNTNIREES